MSKEGIFLRFRASMVQAGKKTWAAIRRLWTGITWPVRWMWEQFRKLWFRFIRWAFLALGLGQSQTLCLPFPSGDWRQQVLDDFAVWLAEIDSPTSSEHPLDLSHDLLEVLTELSALRQEVKRQNKEQSKLNEALGQMEDLYREVTSQFDAKFRELNALRQGVREDTEKSVFLLFADLRDTLRRGLDELRNSSQKKKFLWKPPPGLEGFEEGYEMAMARLQGYETALTQFQEGYEMALARFDQTLTHLGIQRVLTCGYPFDPRVMAAIGTRREPEMEAGIVVEESMSGYVRGEEVLRLAQVVVAVNGTTDTIGD